MKRKKFIADYRVQLGLNQETLAEYLGIERGLFSMAEIGDRPLPAVAHFKLMDLIQAIEQARNMIVPEALLQQEKENLRIALQKELNEINYQLLKQTKELEKLEKSYVDVVLQIQFFEYIRLNPDVLKADEKMQAVLQSQASASLRSWRKNLKAQVLLKQIKVESLALQKQRIVGNLEIL